jgi:flagellar hook-basal body complex protein FliE
MMPLPISAPIAPLIKRAVSREVSDLRPEQAQGQKDFAEFFKKAIASVDDDLKAGDASTKDFLQGRTGIHEMAISLEKADLSLRMLTQVRNRIIDAYKEVSRM